MPRRVLTDEQIEVAAESYRAGATLAEIAKAHDCSSDTVRTVLKHAGVAIRPPHTRPSIMLTAWGETKSVSAWAADPRCAVGAETLRLRITAGWEPEFAIELVSQRREVGESVYGHAVGWVQPELLEPLPPPPPRRVQAPGGNLVTVKTALGTSPASSHPGIVVAWARLGAGGWGCMLVWDGWRRDEHGRERPSARWSWVRHEPRQVVSRQSFPDQPGGLRWFGRHAGGDMEAAYLEAAAALPAGMAEAALTYTPYGGPPA